MSLFLFMCVQKSLVSDTWQILTFIKLVISRGAKRDKGSEHSTHFHTPGPPFVKDIKNWPIAPMYHGSFILPVGFKAPFGLGILAIVLHLFNRPLYWLQILFGPQMYSRFWNSITCQIAGSFSCCNFTFSGKFWNWNSRSLKGTSDFMLKSLDSEF